MRPGKASEVKRTWLGPGVMQIVQGAPGDMAPVVEVGLLPTAGRASAGAGTSMVIWRRNFPSVSKTLMRRVPPAAGVKPFFALEGVLLGNCKLPGAGPGSPPRLVPIPLL